MAAKTPAELIRETYEAIAKGEDIVVRAHEEFDRRNGHGVPVRPPPSFSFDGMIASAVASMKAGRKVAAALTLTRLREDHEGLTDILPDDERNWGDFVRKRIPLPPQEVDQLIGNMVHKRTTLHCTQCDATAVSACGCGAPYVGNHPWAGTSTAKPVTGHDRAVAAIKANPKKSDRTIAAEIGVGKDTVRRARTIASAAIPDAPPDAPPARRVGQDGRSYPASTAKPPAKPVKSNGSRRPQSACDIDWEDHREDDDEPDSVMRARAAEWQLHEGYRLGEEFAMFRPGTEQKEVKRKYIEEANRISRLWKKRADQMLAIWEKRK